MGEQSLHSRLGRWVLAVSARLDSSADVNDVWTCPASVQLNDAVYVSGANAVDQAAASGAAPVIGFVTSKPTSTTAVVQYSGQVSGFNGLVAGTVYYLGQAAGSIVPAGTVQPGPVVQQVGVAKNSTTLLAVILEAV